MTSKRVLYQHNETGRILSMNEGDEHPGKSWSEMSREADDPPATDGTFPYHRPLLYTDTINGRQTMRDNMWVLTTGEIEALLKGRGVLCSMGDDHQPLRWTTAWPEWSGLKGNVEVVPALAWEHAVMERDMWAHEARHWSEPKEEPKTTTPDKSD